MMKNVLLGLVKTLLVPLALLLVTKFWWNWLSRLPDRQNIIGRMTQTGMILLLPGNLETNSLAVELSLEKVEICLG